MSDPHKKPPRSAAVSLAKIVYWLIEEWCARAIESRKGAMLLCDRYYHDLLIDPKRYRYGGPLWAAQTIGHLMPRPNLWILLDAPVEVLQARKQEVTWEESDRQLRGYLSFVKKQQQAVIIDASNPIPQVVEEIVGVIQEALRSNETSVA